MDMVRRPRGRAERSRGLVMVSRETGRSVHATRAIAISAILAAMAVAMLAPAGAIAANSEKVVWLCKPGKKPDPCQESRNATVVTYTGDERHEEVVDAGKSKPPIDCFYV